MPRLLVVLALMVSLATAPTVSSAGEPARLRIDASEVPEAEDVRSEIEDEILPLLREQGIPSEDVRIKIIWLNANDLVAGIYASVDPTVDPLSGRVVRCPDPSEQFCTPAKLPEYARLAVEQSIAAMMQARSGSPPPPVEKPEATTTPSTDPSSTPAPTTEPRSEEPKDSGPAAPKKLGALGWSGVASLILGAGAIGTGAAFVAIGEVRPIPTDQTQVRSLSTPGYALLGVGGALVLVGAVLVGVDRSRAIRRSRQTSLVPSIGPDFATLTVAGRF